MKQEEKQQAENGQAENKQVVHQQTGNGQAENKQVGKQQAGNQQAARKQEHMDQRKPDGTRKGQKKTDQRPGGPGEARIRVASVSDAAALLEIYRPYVEKTAISFECQVPTKAEFEQRIAHTLRKYPYLVAEGEDGLLGYVYTGPFVGRAAYAWSAEVSIYLREDQRRRGIGGRLYRALEEVSRAQHILNLNACIGEPEIEDEYLTKNSVQFHAHMGYRRVGGFHKCGYKFGRWYDMVWMEKLLGPHPERPEPVIPFPELGEALLLKFGIRS